MKAITCTQCGATIENVSESCVIITCDYCRARIMLPGPRKEVPTAQVAPPSVTEPRTSKVGPIVIVGMVAIPLIFTLVPVLIMIVVSLINSASPTPSRAYSDPPTPSTPSSWKELTAVPDKPIPVVNYEPRISWEGPNDLEYFAEPQVDIALVSHLTSEEIKKTVFKNRVVKLRVVITTEGEIEEVEAISGHPILMAAATVSAKSTIFRSRSKPTTRVLTYTFRVLED